MKVKKTIYDECYRLFMQRVSVEELCAQFNLRRQNLRNALAVRGAPGFTRPGSPTTDQRLKAASNAYRCLNKRQRYYVRLRIEWMSQHGFVSDLERLDIITDARDETELDRAIDVLEKALRKRERRRYPTESQAFWHSPLHEVS